MTILGIETSCDETAISVMDIISPHDIVVRANIVSSQIKLHAEFGGVVPNLAAREHVKNIGHVFETALKKADISDFKKEIDLIAVTHGPGLGPALLVGIAFAKTIAMTHDKPLIGVNHMRGHMYSNWLLDSEQGTVNKEQGMKFPILHLVVSGGHTELVFMKDYEDFSLIGETMDDAVGEAFDKVARLLGLGYPGGPAISVRAEQFSVSSLQFPIKFPRPMIHSKDYNFSFSGLKTAVLYKIRDLKKEGVEITDDVVNEIAHAFQEAAVDVLIQKTFRAAKELGVDSVMLSGGVSANKLLRDEFEKAAKENELRYSRPPMEYTTDNAIMIALAGYFAHDPSFAKASEGKEKIGDWQTVDMHANLGF